MRKHNVTVSKIINRIMLDRKKSKAEMIVYGALENIEAREGTPALTVLSQAIRNATPQLQVKSRRIGGATYQVPVEIRPDRSLTLQSGGLSPRPAPGTESPWRRSWPMSWRMPRKARARRSRNGTIRTGWRRRTGLSPTTDGKERSTRGYHAETDGKRDSQGQSRSKRWVHAQKFPARGHQEYSFHRSY